MDLGGAGIAELSRFSRVARPQQRVRETNSRACGEYDPVPSSLNRMKQIIALGGHTLSDSREDLSLSRYLLDQAAVECPRVCFLSQASGEDPSYLLRFYRHFHALGARPADLSLFQPHTADVEGFLLAHDAIYVGGGNTLSMLALWRAWGLERILRAAWEQGTLLAGVSAGAICWFEQGLTDSIPGKLSALDCLGLLPGSCSPHYDGEAERRPSYHRMIVSGEIKPGYGVDDNAALHFRGEDLAAVVTSRGCASAYLVKRGSDGVTETRLEVSNDLELQNSSAPALAKHDIEMDLP